MKEPNYDFVLTFPELGKKTAARAYPGIVYLDYASLCQTAEVGGPESAQLCEAYAKLVQYVSKNGYTVLIDYVYVLPYLKQKHLNGIVAIPRKCDEQYLVGITEDGRAIDFDDKTVILTAMKQFYRETAAKYGYKAVDVDALVVEFHKEDQHHEKKGKAEKSR